MGETKENQKVAFTKMLFSELGESAEYPNEDKYELSLSSYGTCMEMASHTCKVLINNFPWKKAKVLKIETPMSDRNDVSVIKLVTIRLKDGYDQKNPELTRVLKYMVSMLEFENSDRISPILHQLYTDAMANHKFAIDKYGCTKDGEIVSVTFRFALTKWDGKWGKRKIEEDEVTVTGSSDIYAEVEEAEAETSAPKTEKPAKANSKKKSKKDDSTKEAEAEMPKDEFTNTIGDIVKNK